MNKVRIYTIIYYTLFTFSLHGNIWLGKPEIKVLLTNLGLDPTVEIELLNKAHLEKTSRLYQYNNKPL